MEDIDRALVVRPIAAAHLVDMRGSFALPLLLAAAALLGALALLPRVSTPSS